MTPVKLEPGAPRSRVKHSTTEPLHSQQESGHLYEAASEWNLATVRLDETTDLI